MKKIKRSNTVYKCDFCSKRLVKKEDMQIHENSCVRNPDRKFCYGQGGDCSNNLQLDKEEIDELQTALNIGGWNGVFAILDCPACMLSFNISYVKDMDFDYYRYVKMWQDRERKPYVYKA